MNQRLRGAIEAAGVLEIAIERDARSSASGGIERDRRQRAQLLAFVCEALGDDVLARRVPGDCPTNCV
jgi:hypothetical protein